MCPDQIPQRGETVMGIYMLMALKMGRTDRGKKVGANARFSLREFPDQDAAEEGAAGLLAEMLPQVSNPELVRVTAQEVTREVFNAFAQSARTAEEMELPGGDPSISWQV